MISCTTEKVLSQEAIQEQLYHYPAWRIQCDHGPALSLNRTFESFAQALLFVNAVGYLAQQANHHPEIELRYNRVHLTLSTHEVEGITGKDLALMRQIDPLLTQ
jgi:4a-hydroxytetrahydrobiopterin dehydratase